MANRVADAEVKEILNTSLTTTPFIDAANIIVTEKLGTSTLSAAHLKEIERWLAAHLVAIRDSEENAQSKKVGGSAVTMFGESGKGLECTQYGQQAIMLDTTGTLAALGKKKARIDTIDAIKTFTSEDTV